MIADQSLKAREQTAIVNLLQSQLLHGPAKPLHDIARSFRQGLSFGNKSWTISRGGDLDRSCRRTHGTEALGQFVMKHPCEVTPFLLPGFHQTSRQVSAVGRRDFQGVRQIVEDVTYSLQLGKSERRETALQIARS